MGGVTFDHSFLLVVTRRDARPVTSKNSRRIQPEMYTAVTTGAYEGAFHPKRGGNLMVGMT